MNPIVKFVYPSGNAYNKGKGLGPIPKKRQVNYMKATVDKDLCTGCELCTQDCPEVFEMDGDTAKAKVNPVPADAEDCAKDAAEDCPVEAISVEE